MASESLTPQNPTTAPRFTQLVVIGASAGGIEALQQIVPSMRADFPAPVVVAQHLDPRRASQLQEILAARTGASVRVVDAETALEAGVIFVVPADRNVVITDSHVAVHQDNHTGEPSLPGTRAPAHPKPSIDLLFQTAAAAYGEGLIAVVLSGTGSDGAAGARYVKDAGGTVVIQDPATASFPSMPRSLDPTTVDAVVALDRIGPLLRELVATPPADAEPEEAGRLHAFLERLRDESGVDFTHYKMATIARRLQRRIVTTRSEDLDGYSRYLQDNPEEYQRLVSTFLIKVTEFFRDPELFTQLREHVMPSLVADARQRGNEIRLWSAGCATGEEAYSLAILIAEVLGDDLNQFNVRIFATDLDDDAVKYARRGLYPPSALRSLPADLARRYFTEVDDSFEVKKQLRGLVVFGQHDLGQRAPFPRIDLALCRNVLIYFTPELQKRSLQLFAFSLRDRGYLVLGKAETAGPVADYFFREHSHLKIYQRRGARILIPPARIRAASPLPMPRHAAVRRPSDSPLARPARELPRARPLSERPDRALAHLSVGVALVDHRYDIQLINAAARRLLGIHSAAVGDDLVHLSRLIAPGALRASIDRALRGEGHQDVHEVLDSGTQASQPRFLEVACHPLRPADRGTQADYVLVQVNDVTRYRDAEQRAERMAAQLEQLAEINRELLEANEELAAGNAEMRSANEEYLVSSEEAQASTEEVETLNEELQATNEELETLNEELQATVEELNTTNDDLQARSAELQEMTITLEDQRRRAEAERRQQEAVIAGMDVPVMVVDGAGQVTYTNPAYDAVFGAGAALIPQDAGGDVLPRDASPQGLAARGEPFTTEFVHQDGAGLGRRYVATGSPLPESTDGPALDAGSGSTAGAAMVISFRPAHA